MQRDIKTETAKQLSDYFLEETPRCSEFANNPNSLFSREDNHKYCDPLANEIKEEIKKVLKDRLSK